MALLVLLPVVTYFFLTGRRARQASRNYLQRLAHYAGTDASIPSATLTSVFRHFLAFAESGLDKLAAWHGDIERNQLDFPNEVAFENVAHSGRGALLIGAHLGNLEITRALAVTGGVARVNAVVYTKHARRFVSMLAGTSERFGMNLFQVSDFGPDTAIALKEKIALGELLVIVGDRTPPADNDRVVLADFLGHPAPFPQGPFVLAHLLECPVYLFFCLKEGERYRVHLEHFADRVILSRRERKSALAAYAQRYARRLEAYCQRAPLQWFNFFDFWQETTRMNMTQVSPGTLNQKPERHEH
jgi:predicted LPLAT superfamily acyltransferase